MTNTQAIERAMGAIEAQERVTINRGKAKPVNAKEPMAADDADAWNQLRHLSRIL